MSRTKRETVPKFEVGDWVEVQLPEDEYTYAFRRQWDGFMAVVCNVDGHEITSTQLLFSPHRADPMYKGIIKFQDRHLRLVCKKSDIRP